MTTTTGTVKWYNAEKGIGFIEVEGGSDVFCQRSGLATGIESLKDGDAVAFEVKESQRGPEATNVRLL